MTNLQAGTLNRRVTIQTPSTSQDAYGQPLTEWTDLLTTWASVRAASSKEVYAASGYTSSVSHKITIRFPAVTIHNNARVLHGSHIYMVQACTDPDGQQVRLDLYCIERDEVT